jgi:hypothetical protein
MSRKRVMIAAALIAATALAGCQSTRRALGMSKVTPDEFRIVTKAPLVVPPDFALRPPAPGEPRPQELQPESAARMALLGQREAQERSDGEKLLAAKEKSFADRVMFWRSDKKASPAPASGLDNSSAPIDAAAEQERIAKLTGGKPVVIQREASKKIKLPGL